MQAPTQPGNGFRAWYRRQSRVGRISFILTAALVFMFVLGRVWRPAEWLLVGPMIVCAIILSPLLIILLYRWVTRRVLWKVRNRLIVTYALMSLAPVILCLTLFGIAAYIFGGQFATSSAITLLDQAAAQVRGETGGVAFFTTRKQPPQDREGDRRPRPRSALPLWSASVDPDGTLAPLIAAERPGEGENPFVGERIPSWMHAGFHGFVEYKGKLYICAYVEVTRQGHTLQVLGARPLDKETLDATEASLGRVVLVQSFMRGHNGGVQVDEHDENRHDHSHVNVVVVDPSVEKSGLQDDAEDAAKNGEAQHRFERIDSGVLPRSGHLIDPPVVFSAPLKVTSWQTGRDLHGIVTVFSRPSILYTRLFANTNGLGNFVRIILISIAILFALLEFFALLMAAGLSRTITRSVGELYRGTREIDHGNFAHRIDIKRKDQLGALATSFNGMTASIVDLMAQQREKERLLSELSIARELQANLFPQSPVMLPGFEIHAVCQPARTVSGDYFDFIFGRHGNDLCLALGDISGKGISAALLMASLHSAVRAFGLSNSSTGNGSAEGAPHSSPALMLELLNEHIYSSTPPEKYATLFLAYYDAVERKLVYSNAGHLPPMILCADGTVKHLDCGGPPVGLFNGLRYREDSIQLNSGDLLMAFSDGLTEPEQNDEQFGEDRLVNYVREHHADPLPALATNTLHLLKDWIGNREQPDDMTILFARQI